MHAWDTGFHELMRNEAASTPQSCICCRPCELASQACRSGTGPDRGPAHCGDLPELGRSSQLSILCLPPQERRAAKPGSGESPARAAERLCSQLKWGMRGKGGAHGAGEGPGR